MTPTASTPDQVSALNRARDLDAQQGQGHSRLVYSLDGYVYECMTGLPDVNLDIEAKPSRDQPDTLLDFNSQDADGQRGAILRRLDMTTGFSPPQLVFHRPAGSNTIQASPMPGLLAGVSAQHPFQVIHVGRDKWHIGAGKVLVDDEVIHEIDAATVRIDHGWIGLLIAWEIKTLLDYSPKLARFVAQKSLRAAAAPERTADGSVTEGETWSEGNVFHPIAYVQKSTTGSRPVVSQIQHADLKFRPGAGFPWGVLGPRSLAV